MTACQVKLKTDDRLGILIPCGKPEAAMVRVSCPRAAHVETIIMCKRCTTAITYCETCLAEDKLLVRASVLVLTR